MENCLKKLVATALALFFIAVVLRNSFGAAPKYGKETAWFLAKSKDGSLRIVPRAKLIKEHGQLECGETMFFTNRFALQERRPRPPGGGYGWPSSPLRNPPRYMNPDDHGFAPPRPSM